MRRNLLLAAMAFAALAIGHPAAGLAKEYPEKAVKIVVGFPPGGANDILARLIGQKLSDKWGQPFIVENKPGANAIIATEFVARAPADGYTLMVGASGAMTVNPGVYDKLPYDPIKDFEPITLMSTYPLIMGVHPDVPARSVKDLVALAKGQPGKLNYASGSTPFQLATELFKRSVGIDVAHIPYKGSAASVTATIAGDAQFLIVDIPPAVQLVKSGKLRGLAVTGPTRMAELPDLPTMAEAGYPDIEVLLFTGLFAPRGTPRPIVDKLQTAIAEVLKQPDVKERLASLGLDPGGTTPDETGARVKRDLDKWVKVAREAGVKADQ